MIVWEINCYTIANNKIKLVSILAIVPLEKPKKLIK